MASSKKARLLQLRTYGHLYERADAPRSVCLYCGDVASTLDHCPPLASAHLWEKSTRSRPKFLLVPACCECNSLLGDRHLVSLDERVNFVFKRLSTKYERNFVLWPEPDIEEMSPMFQKTIRAKKRSLGLLLTRVRHAELCALNGLDHMFGL